MALLGPGAAVFATSLAAGQTIGAAHDAAITEAPDFDLATVLGILISGQTLHRFISGDAP
jgi:hypothetical protein